MYTARKTRVNRRRQLTIRGLIFMAILVALFALAAALGWIKLGRSSNELKPSVLSVKSPYCFTGSGFVYMNNSTLLYNDFKSKESWSVALATSDIQLAASPAITVVYSTVAMQAISTQTGVSLFPNVEFTGTVVAVRCSNSYIAVLKKDTRNIHTLYLYDAKGTKLDSFTLGANAVLDFGFYGSTERFWTLALNTSGVSPISTITTFNTGQSNTGIMPIEGQIVDKLYFNEDTAIYAVGTNNLMSFDNVGKETARRLIYGWKVLDYEQVALKPVFLLTPRKQTDASPESNIAKIISLPEGNTDAYINLPTGSLGAYLCGGKVVAVTPNELFYYSLKGDLTDRISLKSTVDFAQKLNSSRLLLALGEKSYILEIS